MNRLNRKKPTFNRTFIHSAMKQLCQKNCAVVVSFCALHMCP